MWWRPVGADIHGPWVYMNSGSASSTPWAHRIATFNWGRDYTRFGLLADVRKEEGTAVVPPRGWPEDAWFSGHIARLSEEGHSLYDSDCHSHSWLTMSELSEVSTRYTELAGHSNVDLGACLMFMAWMGQHQVPPFGSEMFIVFCFDN
jgi:hypothetical protein